jgi:hypothetical protein
MGGRRSAGKGSKYRNARPEQASAASAGIFRLPAKRRNFHHEEHEAREGQSGYAHRLGAILLNSAFFILHSSFHIHLFSL